MEVAENRSGGKSTFNTVVGLQVYHTCNTHFPNEVLSLWTEIRRKNQLPF